MKLRFLAALGSAIVLLAGCGGKADCPPGSSDASASPSASARPSASASKPPPKPTYTFGLPIGDNSVDERAESLIYVILDKGGCTQAQTELDQRLFKFEMPQEIILYQAAIDLCLNHTRDAKNTYALVTGNSEYYPSGWLGIGWHKNDQGSVLSWHICELYKSVTSVLEQKSGDSISCKYSDLLSLYQQDWAASPDDPRKRKASTS